MITCHSCLTAGSPHPADERTSDRSDRRHYRSARPSSHAHLFLPTWTYVAPNSSGRPRACPQSMNFCRAPGHLTDPNKQSYDMPRTNAVTKLTVQALTPDLWPALEDLFGNWGASNGCWCMYWRLGGAYRGRREENKRALRNIVRSGFPPGLLAFHGKLAVGWCQLTPRAA